MTTRSTLAYGLILASSVCFAVLPASAETPSVRYPLTIADGKVSGPADVSGSIGRGGIVRVSIRGAYANGQLSGNGGSGKWNGASGGILCSGRWEALRQ
jgi:hypothetical protein